MCLSREGARQRTEVLLSLTLANAMVQNGTTVQCQPLRGRDIRSRQGHGGQALNNPQACTHTQTNTSPFIHTENLTKAKNMYALSKLLVYDNLPAP